MNQNDSTVHDNINSVSNGRGSSINKVFQMQDGARISIEKSK